MPVAGSSRRAAALVAALGLSLATGLLVAPTSSPRSRDRSAVAVAAADPGTGAASAPAFRARALPPPDREQAVAEVLARRAAAVLAHDDATFLATVDPQATAFRVRQARLVDALAGVPLATWSYVADTGSGPSPDPVLDARYGLWWGGRVVLRYQLAGIDAEPVEMAQYLSFVRRGTRWYVAADDDPGLGGSTDRAIWDDGPVTSVRDRGVLVLGHKGSQQDLSSLQQLAADLAAAIPRVTAVWGPGWSQRVAAVLPSDQAELARLAPGNGDLTDVAALALVARGPVGDRVFLNPATLPRLSTAGRQVVLTHELTHVATRAATGPASPTWLVEGLADYVGYHGADVPVADAAAELQADVRAGRLPDRLPTTADFTGAHRAQAYEQSWLAVTYLAQRYGVPALLRLYRDLGAQAGPDGNSVLDQALRTATGTTTAALTAGWRELVRERLS